MYDTNKFFFYNLDYLLKYNKVTGSKNSLFKDLPSNDFDMSASFSAQGFEVWIIHAFDLGYYRSAYLSCL